MSARPGVAWRPPPHDVRKLRDALEEYAGSRAARGSGVCFNMGLYAEMAQGASPNISALSLLEPLLSPIIKSAPQAFVSLTALTQALWDMFLAELVPAGIACRRLAEEVARSIATALAHMRRLKQVPRVLVQRSRGISSEEMAAYYRMASLMSDVAGEAAATLASSGDVSDGGAWGARAVAPETPARAERFDARRREARSRSR